MFKPSSAKTQEWILQGMERVLRYHGITHEVIVELAGKFYDWPSQDKRRATKIHGWSAGLPGRPTKPLPGRPKPLPSTDAEKRALRGFHRALKYRGIEAGVSVQLNDRTYTWVCRTDANGNKTCRWE